MTHEATTLRLEVRVGGGDRSTMVFQPGTAVDPVSIGHDGSWRIEAVGVADVHAYVFFDGAALFIASANPDEPALLDGRPVPSQWTPLNPPSEIALGTARLEVRAERNDWEDEATEPSTAVVDKHKRKRKHKRRKKPPVPRPTVDDEATRQILPAQAEADSPPSSPPSLPEKRSDTQTAGWDPKALDWYKEAMHADRSGAPRPPRPTTDDESTSKRQKPQRPKDFQVIQRSVDDEATRLAPLVGAPPDPSPNPYEAQADLPRPRMHSQGDGDVVTSAPRDPLSVPPPPMVGGPVAAPPPTGAVPPPGGAITPPVLTVASPDAGAVPPGASPEAQMWSTFPGISRPGHPQAIPGPPPAQIVPGAPFTPNTGPDATSKSTRQLSVGGKIVAAWRESSVVQKIVLCLLPFAFVAIFVVFDDGSSGDGGASPAASASASASTSAMASASAAAASASAAASTPTLSASALPTVASKPPPRPRPRWKKAEPTLERKAADAVAAGSYDEALLLYERLANENPDKPVYREAMRIVRSKAKK